MYKEIEPLIPNTICEVFEDNEKASYIRIRPTEGYKLHEITLDEPVFDEETMAETGKKKLGFTKAYVTASGSYDFDKNEREIYATPLDYEAIVDVEGNNSEIEEKAKAYDILMGVDV
jgi:hypothetical protein